MTSIYEICADEAHYLIHVRLDEHSSQQHKNHVRDLGWQNKYLDSQGRYCGPKSDFPQ
jgi:hypothetical protein